MSDKIFDERYPAPVASQTYSESLDRYLAEPYSRQPHQMIVAEATGFNAAELLSERNTVLSSLTPGQKAELLRVQAQTAKRSEFAARPLVNAIDPRLAKVNERIDNQLALLTTQVQLNSLSFDTQNLYAQQSLHRKSTVECHSRSSDANGSTQSLDFNQLFLATTQEQDERTLRRSNESLYAPYARPIEVGRKFGLDVEFRGTDNATPVYTMGTGSEKLDIPVQPGPNAKTELAAMRKQWLADMQKEFGVEITPANTPIPYVYGKVERITPHMSADPRLDQLEGIGQALDRSRSTLAAGKIKITFTNDQLIPGHSDGGLYSKDVEGGPTIFVMNDATKDQAGARSLMLHELAHRHQDKSDWYGNDSDAEKMGWQKAGNRWLLKGKDGEFFANVRNYGYDWVRTDEKGYPLKLDGKPIPPGTEFLETIQSKDLVDRALIKPPSNYFTNPTEMMAEAMAQFRGTSAERRNLQTTTPVIYELAKQRDQREIDGAFSERVSKQHRLRLPSGEVVPATAQAAKQLAEFEAGR